MTFTLTLTHTPQAQVFLAVVRAHADAATRETLTQLLFNLIKKPNAAQRRTIMDGYCRRLNPQIPRLSYTQDV